MEIVISKSTNITKEFDAVIDGKQLLASVIQITAMLPNINILKYNSII